MSRLIRMPLSPHQEVDAVVTTVTPFGVLVRTDDGLPGLVHGASDPVGSHVHVRVLEVDDDRRRFSAELV